MSRTRHHRHQRRRKSIIEYWSRRKGTRKAGSFPGRLAKTITSRLQRRWTDKQRHLEAEIETGGSAATSKPQDVPVD